MLANIPIVKVMDSPSTNGTLIDELLYGMQVKISKKSQDDWVMITTFYGYEGFVKKSNLIPKVKDNYEKYIVTEAFADVLIKPEIKSQCIITLNKGSIIKLAEKERDEYSKIILNNGKEGFIKRCFIKKYDILYPGKIKYYENELRNEIVNTALSYIGTQYRWGGKTNMGIDCSGLCSMAYLINNIIICRDAYINENFPVKIISISKINKADLLYYRGHMAMYIGNNKIIHGTNKAGIGKVTINSLDSNALDYRKDLEEIFYYAGSVF